MKLRDEASHGVSKAAETMVRREERDGSCRERLLEATGHDFPEDEARQHLRHIEARQLELQKAVGRPVRFEVAALDYLTDGPAPIAPQLRLVDGAHMDQLLGQTRTDALTGALNRRGLE